MTKRRGHGEGSIYQRKDGRWAATIDLGWRDGKRKRKTVYGKTRREVADRLRVLQTQIAQGLPVPPERLTTRQYLIDWHANRLPEALSPNTVENYRWVIESHLVPDLGRIRLVKLNPGDVEAMLERKADAGYSSGTRMRIRSVLVLALRQAEVEGLVT